MKQGWEIKKLGEVCDFQNGFAFQGKSYKESGLPILRITNIQNDEIDTKELVYFDTKDYKVNLDRFKVYQGDLLIAMSGATTGKLGINKSETVFYLNQRVGKFIPKKFLNKAFLYYFLTTKVEESLRIAAGAAQPNLSTEQINNFEIPLPPLPEQQRIVSILDEAFAAIAKAKANAEQNLKNAKELFESYLHGVFEKKGDGWKKTKLSQLFDVKHGFAFQGEYFSNSGEFVLLTPGNFFEEGGYRDRGEKQKYYIGEIPKDFILKKSDLLVAMTEQAAGLLGSPILVPSSDKFLHNQRLGLIIPKPNVEIDNEFFFHVFNLKKVRKALHDSGTGVKVRHTSPTKIGQVEIYYPKTLKAQQIIVRQLDALRAETQKLEAVYQKKIDDLEELKKSILQKAFAGELKTEKVVAV